MSEDSAEFIGITIGPNEGAMDIRTLYTGIQSATDALLAKRSLRTENRLKVAVQKLGAYLDRDYETLWRLTQQECEWREEELRRPKRVQFALPAGAGEVRIDCGVVLGSSAKPRTEIVRSVSQETLDPSGPAPSGGAPSAAAREAFPLFQEPSPTTLESRARPFRLSMPPVLLPGLGLVLDSPV